MKRGKLIVIEGTDCSGKETQTRRLIENLEKNLIKCANFSFPFYSSPTGKIIAGPYLEKPQYNIKGYFPEGAPNVPAKVACLYYAADREYNINKIISLLNQGVNVILDRYVESNMAHQGGKEKTKKKRDEIINFIDSLEYKLLNLPRPDLTIFLYMPTKVSFLLKKNREEKPDQHENDPKHLEHAEKTYLYLAKKYNFKKINCSYKNNPRSIEDISYDVFNVVKAFLGK